MSDIIAKPVIKNKFWIVESKGAKIATIQAINEGNGGVAFVFENKRELFPSIKLLSKKYNIEFVKVEKVKPPAETLYTIHGFPAPHKPHNVLFDLHKQLPIFTKTNKSKSFFCAGYYIIKFNHSWARAYCPKLITLNRYDYKGPYASQTEMMEQLRVANGS